MKLQYASFMEVVCEVVITPSSCCSLCVHACVYVLCACMYTLYVPSRYVSCLYSHHICLPDMCMCNNNTLPSVPLPPSSCLCSDLYLHLYRLLPPIQLRKSSPSQIIQALIPSWFFPSLLHQCAGFLMSSLWHLAFLPSYVP